MRTRGHPRYVLDTAKNLRRVEHALEAHEARQKSITRTALPWASLSTVSTIGVLRA